MEFSTLDKMVEELEQEKLDYVNKMEKRIAIIKQSIETMKDEYRKETMPKVSGMVEYLLERAKKRLGKEVIEACDITEDMKDAVDDTVDGVKDSIKDTEDAVDDALTDDKTDNEK